MTTQLSFTGPPEPVQAARFTSYQRAAWEAATSLLGGADAAEAGARIHELAGKHGRDERCQWCGQDGAQVFRSAGLRPLLVRRRGSGRWEPRDRCWRYREEMGDIPW